MQVRVNLESEIGRFGLDERVDGGRMGGVQTRPFMRMTVWQRFAQGHACEM